MEVQQSEDLSRRSIFAAIAANIGVAIVKFIAYLATSSVSILSESIHSLVDCGNGILVLVGIHKSKKEANHAHPFGCGKELYFYTMIVSLMIFLFGGGIAIYQGITAIYATVNGFAEQINPFINYIVLGLAIIFEGLSLRVAIINFNKARGDTPPLQFIKNAKDPSLYTVVLEDSAAEIGLLFALLGNILTHITGNNIFDGIGSILIGLLLCCVSILLLRETKGLLVGEGVTQNELEKMRNYICSDYAVQECGKILTMYLGPNNLVVVANVSIQPKLSCKQVDHVTDSIATRIRTEWPEAKEIFVEVESFAECREEHNEQDSWEAEEN